MKKLLLALGILALICSPAMAGRNANGAIVVHTDNALHFSVGWDYCANNPLPGNTCESLNPTSNHAVDESTMIWAVGAWMTTASPGVTAYQFGVYHDEPVGNFDAWSPCGPGFLEIPDATWPESGTGTAVAYGNPVYPQWTMKLYWFATYGIAGSFSTGAYPHGPMVAQFADDSNPPQTDDVFHFGTVRWAPETGVNDCPSAPATVACCFPNGSCQDLLEAECVGQGGTPEGVGTTCATFQCPPPMGACCFAPTGECRDLIETECTAAGGTWEGFGTDCATFQCPVTPVGACCIGEACTQTIQADCSGTWLEGVPCEPTNPCLPILGACCIDGNCTQTTQTDCASSDWREGVACEPNPCPPVPTKSSTWGQIKGSYR